MTHPETFKLKPPVVYDSKQGLTDDTRVATRRENVAERGHGGTYAPSHGVHITVSLARAAEAPSLYSTSRGDRVAT